MCLLKAKKMDVNHDIKVYKTLIVSKSSDGSEVYSSPFHREMFWKIGERHLVGIPRAVTEIYEASDHKGTVINVYGNAFHSWANVSDARDLAVSVSENGSLDTAVGEFVIPGDSKYVYCGDSAVWPYSFTFAPGYASSDLVFVGIVERFYERGTLGYTGRD